ncbi:hypothetical protein EW145_g858 [Phellinidium pouzarii]|uniref:Xylanolytic transcriptional activator regulatory domain-containing protein n=1 Tax=Phellinidium pouzarii TaxID=167371 RepID=A0A4S4LGX4_9AGAM|nr:hypothetical protein EW145_g858 [Phellinidium pouzarii]
MNFTAFVDWPSAPLTESLVRRALHHLHPSPSFVSSLSCAEKPTLQWCSYDSMDHELTLSNPLTVLSSSITIRKALIRKHFLYRCLHAYTTKHPESILLRSVPQTWDIEISFADELDEMWSDDLWDLGEELDRSGDKWWILKPGMADRGIGIRLFNSKETLQSIFEAFEEDSDEEEDVKSEEDPTNVALSQLRHFVIQEYLPNPILIDPREVVVDPKNISSVPSKEDLKGHKFHLRAYCVASGALSVYLYPHVLALFSSEPYKKPSEISGSSGSFDLRPHLTNTCLQEDKGEENVRLLQELIGCSILSSYEEKITKNDIDSFLKQIAEIIAETFRAALQMPVHFQPLPNNFELFGIDFLVNHKPQHVEGARFQVQLLEINSEPAIELTGPRLRWILADLFELIGRTCIGPFFNGTKNANTAPLNSANSLCKCLEANVHEHPEGPQCSYDPIEGLTLSDSINPGEKIRQLEEQIAELKRKLQEAGIANSPTPSEFLNGARSSPAERRLSSLAPPSYTVISSPELVVPAPRSDISLPRGGLDVARSLRSTSPASLPRSTTSSPDMNGQGPESLLSLFAYGWNPDLPGPAEMRRIIEAFFTFDPCGSRILHRPSFLASLDLSPKDSRFPHSSILHAICASASRWTSTDYFVSPDGIRRDTFADYHAGKTRQYIDRTMASGSDIFFVLQACVILSWYFYAEGRWVEVWIFSGFQTRVAVPLRLNHRGTFTTHGTGSPGAYLAPPKDQKDLELRGWLHGIEYKHIATELLLRRDDFESDVTDLNTEFQLKYSSPRADNPMREPAFRTLDKLVSGGFLESLPTEYKSYLYTMGQNPDSVDSDLFMVHLIPHAASITLHNPYIDFNDPQSLSTRRCIAAADAILEAYYTFSKAVAFSSNYLAFPPLISRLHPFVTICWYLAAVVKIQVCKRMIDCNQASAEVEIWGEINAMRHAMMDYGSISPIGTRQERLLKTLMDEIVRVTSQERPLEIPGSRLYPFSHKSAFQNPDDTGAPLPTSAPIDSYGNVASSSLGVAGVHAHMQARAASHHAQPHWLHAHSDMSRSQSSPSHSSSSGSFMP